MPPKKKSRGRQPKKQPAPKPEPIVEDQVPVSSPKKLLSKKSTKTLLRQPSESSDSDLALPFNSPISKRSPIEMRELSKHSVEEHNTLCRIYSQQLNTTGASVGSINKPSFKKTLINSPILEDQDIAKSKSRSKSKIKEIASQPSLSMNYLNPSYQKSMNNSVQSENIPLSILNFMSDLFIPLIITKSKFINFCTSNSPKISAKKLLLFFSIIILTALSYFLITTYMSRESSQTPLNLDFPPTKNSENLSSSSSLDLESRLAPYKKAIKTLESTINSLKQSLHTVNSKLVDLPSLNSQITSLSSTVNNQSSSISSLSSKVSSLTTLSNSLASENSSLKSQISNLKPSTNTLSESSITDITSKIEVNNKAINSLEKKLSKYFYSDKTGKFDWALYSNGGRVLQVNSIFYTDNKLLNFSLQILMNVLGLQRKVKNKMIMKNFNNNDCTSLSLEGNYFIIKFKKEIRITEIVYESLDKNIIGDKGNMPKRIEFFGIGEGKAGERKLGEIMNKNKEGEYMSSVEIGEEGKFRRIKGKLVESYGDKGFACLYRVRVHGE